jgi:hypothetical protein
MVQQQCTRCGFRTQATPCENCGSGALDALSGEPVPVGPMPLRGVDLLNAPVEHVGWDAMGQRPRENPAVP